MNWHSLEPDEVLEKLSVPPDEGLSDSEAERRIEEHGPNRIREEKKDSSLRRLLRQFNDVLIYILLAAALLTAFMEHWVDTGVILAVVIINAIIGYIQEGKAEEAALTGESEPVGKSVGAVEAEAGVGDRTSMLFSGTTVVRGNARGVVVATGEENEVGKIGELVAEVEELQTPLQKKVGRFARWLRSSSSV